MKAIPKGDGFYSSAEFQLESPGIFYQFKLRKTDSEPMFALLRGDSKALECLKTGDVIPMTFHYQDKIIPAERRKTRIKYIVDGNPMGFKDHFMIALDIYSDKDKEKE